MDTIATAPLFGTPPCLGNACHLLKLLGLLYSTESMAISMREMELRRAERARGPRSGGKSTVEEISLVTDPGDCLAARGVQ